jgi:hypothetical protein
MKTDLQHTVHSEEHGKQLPSPYRFIVWILILACLGALGVLWKHGRTSQTVQNRESEAATTQSQSTGQKADASHPAKTQLNSGSVKKTIASPRKRPDETAYMLQPTPVTRQLVTDLVNLAPPGGVMTEEQAAAWKHNLQLLIQNGAEAVPAISEFLAKNADLVFTPDERQALGYVSAREAMIDALVQIATPNAEAALTGVLQATADPREIAQLAQGLEKLEPGVYQPQILDATRQTLAMAARGGLPGWDTAPLFQVLQQYGGPDAVTDLEGSASQWNYYAMIALAKLPDGSGINSLAQIASGQSDAGSGARVAALEMLAQVATQSPDALNALLDQARQGKLSAFDWASMLPILAGNQIVYQNSAFGGLPDSVNPNDMKTVNIPASGQRFFTAPLAAMTPEQIAQQQKLISQLQAVTTDPVGKQTLQQANTMLGNRLAQFASAAGQ